MIRTRTRAAAVTTTAAAAALGLALLSACDGSYGSHSSANAGGGRTPGTSAEQSAPRAVSAQLAAATVGDLGQVVTDSNGMTLYRFDQDTANPPATHCVGQCAVKWPPALVSGDGTVTLKGIDKSLVGTVTRPDGSKQLTLHGWPLYRYGSDAAPGDAKGQGVGGTWFAATPQGAKATAHAASKDSGGSYGDDYGY